MDPNHRSFGWAACGRAPEEVVGAGRVLEMGRRNGTSNERRLGAMEEV